LFLSIVLCFAGQSPVLATSKNQPDKMPTKPRKKIEIPKQMAILPEGQPSDTFFDVRLHSW